MKTLTVHYYYGNTCNYICISFEGFLQEGTCKKKACDQRQKKEEFLLHKIHYGSVSEAFIPN